MTATVATATVHSRFTSTTRQQEHPIAAQILYHIQLHESESEGRFARKSAKEEGPRREGARARAQHNSSEGQRSDSTHGESPLCALKPHILTALKELGRGAEMPVVDYGDPVWTT